MPEMNEQNVQNPGMQEDQPQQVDLIALLVTFLKGVKRLWFLLIIFTLLGGALMYVRADRGFVPVYESRATFIVSAKRGESSATDYSFYYDKSVSAQMAKTFPYIISSDLMMDTIKEDLGVDYLNATVTASSIAESNLFEIKATGNDKEAVYDVLKAVIDHYQEVARVVVGETNLKTIAEPTVPRYPTNINSAHRSAAKGAILGFLFACGLIFLLMEMRDTIQNEKDVENKLAVKTLGSLPWVYLKKRRNSKGAKITIHERRVEGDFVESFKSLSMRLESEMREKQQQIVMVTSTKTGEGVSMVAENLALSFADMGRKVIYVEFGPSRDSHIDKIATSIQVPRLNEVIAGQNRLEQAFIKSDYRGLTYMTYHEETYDHKGDYSANKLEDVMKELRGMADLIVFDASVDPKGTDASVAAALCDTIVYVVRQDMVRASKIIEGLEDACCYGAQFGGIILNGIQKDLASLTRYGENSRYRKYGYSAGYGYGQRYGYGYGYGYGRRRKGGRYGKDGKRYGERYGQRYGDRYGDNYGRRYGDDYGSRYGADYEKRQSDKEDKKS